VILPSSATGTTVRLDARRSLSETVTDLRARLDNLAADSK